MTWLPARTTVAATAEPVALAAAKEFLRVDHSVFDAEISGYCAGARAQIEVITGLRLAPQTVLLQASSWLDLEQLPIAPVTSMTGITYLDRAGDVQDLDEDAWEEFGAELSIGARPTIGAQWPDVRPVSDAIRVTAAVGYEPADLPADLRLALLLHIKGQFEGREADIWHLLVNHRLYG